MQPALLLLDGDVRLNRVIAVGNNGCVITDGWIFAEIKRLRRY